MIKLLVLALLACFCDSRIYIKNNAYQRLVIVIGDGVKEDWNLIQKVKDVFTDASKYLHALTRQRAFFGNISIVVPMSWSNKGVTHQMTYESGIKDIWIDHPSGSSHTPYVAGLKKCGGRGNFMKLTPSFFTSAAVAKPYGPREKLIAHEWGHLRYGVYDEYAYPNEPQVYLNNKNIFEGTRCTAAINGSAVNRKTGKPCVSIAGKPEPDCRFRVNNKGLPGHGSIMFMQHYTDITEFCDNNTHDPMTHHNKHAPNRQHRLCKGKSVWEILREHEDFRGGSNPPRQVASRNLIPQFRVVKQIPQRIVVVLDVSGSMDTNNRLRRLGKACSLFLRTYPDGYRVALVKFSTYAAVLFPLAELNKQSRINALAAIPRTTEGSTAIGKGILLGINILRKSGGTSGGKLLVVSDGEEIEPPFIDGLTPMVIKSGVMVHSVSISDGAETQVDKLADLTQGTKAYVSEKGNSNALNEAFSALANAGITDPADRSQTLLSAVITVSGSNPYSGSVWIDQSLGSSTQFTFQYDTVVLDLSITAPNGSVYDNSSLFEHDSSLQTYSFTPNRILEIGEWKFNVSCGQNQSVTIYIQSRRRSPDIQPITAEAEWGSRHMNGSQDNQDKQRVYITVAQGNSPVVNADIQAIIERPGVSNPVTLTCRDNGAGADAVADDGVYSAYFISINQNGRYNLKANIDSKASTIVSPGSIVGVGAMGLGVEEDNPDHPTGRFQRITTGGSFEMVDYQVVTYPPDPVTDLKMEGINFNSRAVTLTWTSSGNQADKGKAAGYEIRYSFDVETFEDDYNSGEMVEQSMIEGSFKLDTPRVSGMVENITIILPHKGGSTCALALRVMGQHGYSDVSNLVNVPLEQPTFAQEQQQQQQNLLLIIGLAGAATLLLVICIAAALFLVKHRKSSKI